MTEFDYLFPLLLCLSVVRQIRGKRLNRVQLAWPVGLVVWATVAYVRGFPATPVDLLLVCGCAAVGVALGSAAGRHTRVYASEEGAVMARASGTAVALWIVGTIGRLAFGLCAEHGGGPAIARFSAAHSISLAAWPAALTLMALAEVLGRTAVLASRMIVTPARTPAATR